MSMCQCVCMRNQTLDARVPCALCMLWCLYTVLLQAWGLLGVACVHTATWPACAEYDLCCAEFKEFNASKAEILVDKQSGRSRGFGFVWFDK